MELRRFKQDKSCVFAESFGDLQYLRNKYTVNGKPTITNSQNGKSMLFNGVDQNVSIGLDTNYGITSALTVICQIKPDGLISGMPDAFPHIFGTPNWNFFAYNADGLIYAKIIDAASGAHQIAINAAPGANANLNIAMTYDGTTQYVYVNGTKQSASSSWSSTVKSPETFTVGGDAGLSKIWKGNVDFGLVFKRAFSEDEILDIATGKAF